MNVTISYDNLAVMGFEESSPITTLDLDENCHIHGALKFQIGSRIVPYMGFWGPDDVCFSSWILEFENIIKKFDNAEILEYTFDEGEQGQPAYLFEKNGDKVFLSIVDSEFSGGKADSEWQKIEFSYAEFRDQYLEFRKSFLLELRNTVPLIAEKWKEEFLLIKSF